MGAATAVAAGPWFSPPTAARLDYPRSLKPLYQGEFDGLCAAYAIVNGIRLLTQHNRPLEYGECEALFRRAIGYLSTEERLTSTIAWGAPLMLWRALQAYVVEQASYLTARRIFIDHPFSADAGPSLEEFADVVRLAIDAQQPALILWRGRRSHYTVVSGHTQFHLTLFDSAGRRRLAWRSCDTVIRPRARYQLVPDALTLLSLG